MASARMNMAYNTRARLEKLEEVIQWLENAQQQHGSNTAVRTQSSSPTYDVVLAVIVVAISALLLFVYESGRSVVLRQYGFTVCGAIVGGIVVIITAKATSSSASASASKKRSHSADNATTAAARMAASTVDIEAIIDERMAAYKDAVDRRMDEVVSKLTAQRSHAPPSVSAAHSSNHSDDQSVSQSSQPHHEQPNGVDVTIDIDDLCADADRRHDEALYEVIADTLSRHLTHITDTQWRRRLMWRLARAHYNISQETESLGPSSQHAKHHIFRGLDWAERALSLQLERGNTNTNTTATAADRDDVFNIHKWYAVLLALSDRFVGDKERIRNARLIRKNAQIALKLNTNDYELHHALGRLSLEVARIPWTMRKMAKVAYGELPEASFEEARDHFLEVQRMRPHWKLNNLYLAKALIELKDPGAAKHLLVKLTAGDDTTNGVLAAPSPSSSSDDNRAVKDAKKLLTKLNKGGWW